MSPEVERLKELIDNSDNIVFFGEREYQQKVIFLISEVKTVYIMRLISTVIRLKQC